MNSLTEHLHKIQSQYFPLWDIKHKYHVEMWDLPGARCNWKEKLIQLSEDDELTIIHEICHAVARTGWHRGKWMVRYLKVADMAENLGKDNLAKAIRSDTGRYQEQFKDYPERKTTAKNIRSDINDAVFDLPNASFEDIVGTVAGENSMFSEELLTYYPKSAKMAFDKAHHDLEDEKALRQKFGIND